MTGRPGGLPTARLDVDPIEIGYLLAVLRDRVVRDPGDECARGLYERLAICTTALGATWCYGELPPRPGGPHLG